MFVGIGLSGEKGDDKGRSVQTNCPGIFPLLHHFYMQQEFLSEATSTLIIRLGIMAFFYILGNFVSPHAPFLTPLPGAFLFATRIPECFFPGKCNIFVSIP